MFNKLKQFKTLKDRAKEIQTALAAETSEGSGGWGKVKVVINGNQQIISVSIDPSVMDDKTKLEGMIKDATNEAIQKISKIMSTKIKDIGGLDLASEFGEAMKH